MKIYVWLGTGILGNLETPLAKESRERCHLSQLSPSVWSSLGPTSVVDESTGHGNLHAQTIGRGMVGKRGWEEGAGGNRDGCVGIYYPIQFNMWGG